MRQVCEWHKSCLSLDPFLLTKLILFVFPFNTGVAQHVASWVATGPATNIPVAKDELVCRLFNIGRNSIALNC